MMTTNTSTDTKLILTRTINASPAEVFRAWTDPTLLSQWSCPEGTEMDGVTVDLKVGGSFKIRMKGENQHYTAFGTYREIQPPKRLVYTWDWEEADNAMGDTLITVEFEAEGEGTRVVMTHDLLPTAELAAAHDEGWTSCLDRLEALFA